MTVNKKKIMDGEGNKTEGKHQTKTHKKMQQTEEASNLTESDIKKVPSEERERE